MTNETSAALEKVEVDPGVGSTLLHRKSYRTIYFSISFLILFYFIHTNYILVLIFDGRCM